jgi:hypothetical protein
VLKRIGFIIIAMLIATGVGGTVSATDAWIKPLIEGRDLDLVFADVWLWVYFPLLLLFPRRTDGLAAAVGLLAGLIATFYGPWQLSVIPAGLLSFILHLFVQRKAYPGAVINLIILGIVSKAALEHVSLAELGSSSYFYLWIGLIIFGFIAHFSQLKWQRARDEKQTVAQFEEIQQKMSRHQGAVNTPGEETLIIANNTSTARQHVEGSKSQPVATSSKKETTVKGAKTVIDKMQTVAEAGDAAPTTEQLMDAHKQVVLHLLRQAHKLPEYMSVHVVKICEYTRLIMNSMENDPRDFVPGDKFLSRYLNGAKAIVDNCISLSARTESSPKLDEVWEKGKVTLAELAEAFVKQHHRLLENDALDLATEAGFLERLLKMEGFK